MIVRPHLHWLRMLLVWRGSVVPKILPRLGFFFALSWLVVLTDHFWGPLPLRVGPAPLGLLGVTLAIFLGFRNSTSYDRFWEGRKLWGSLVIVARSFARQCFTLPEPALTRDERLRVAALLTRLARTLNQQLRGGEVRESESPPLVLDDDFERRLNAAKYKPALVMAELGRELGAWRTAGRVSDILTAAMDRNLDRLSEVVGGCERISSTPIPYVYSVMLYRTVYLYSAILPFALVESLGWSTPWVAVFVSYTFIALDSVTAELEDPFGVEPNDLPLDALTRTVQRAVLELAGEPLPPDLQPDHGFQLL